MNMNQIELDLIVAIEIIENFILVEVLVRVLLLLIFLIVVVIDVSHYEYCTVCIIDLNGVLKSFDFNDT